MYSCTPPTTACVMGGGGDGVVMGGSEQVEKVEKVERRLVCACQVLLKWVSFGPGVDMRWWVRSVVGG